MRRYFDRELDTVATFWRVYRKDGVALAFSSHNRDLFFSGLNHRSAPGIVPAAIRMTTAISDDSAEVTGALTHDTISEKDLAAGLFDRAAIEIGLVDWEGLASHVLYSGVLGTIEDDRRGFSAELRSAKDALNADLVPRTSPTCRAQFCGKGCNLSSSRFTSKHQLSALVLDSNQVLFDGVTGSSYIDGTVRFLEGPQAGIAFSVVDSIGSWLTLDRPIREGLEVGAQAELTEGCDHTLATCSNRFNNARNFRGEPFLPGNDLLARYGQGNA